MNWHYVKDSWTSGGLPTSERWDTYIARTRKGVFFAKLSDSINSDDIVELGDEKHVLEHRLFKEGEPSLEEVCTAVEGIRGFGKLCQMIKSRLLLMSLPKLSKSAPEGLVLIPKTDWTAYEKRIWDGFDANVDNFIQGMGPHNSQEAIGRMNGRPAIIARIAFALESETMWLWNDDHYYRVLNIGSTIFSYPKESRENHWEDMDCYDADILEGDGEYDVFKDEIPEEFMSDVKEMFEEARVWLEGENELKLEDYVKEQVGSVDKIVDPKVRAHIKNVIAKG